MDKEQEPNIDISSPESKTGSDGIENHTNIKSDSEMNEEIRTRLIKKIKKDMVNHGYWRN